MCKKSDVCRVSYVSEASSEESSVGKVELGMCQWRAGDIAWTPV